MLLRPALLGLAGVVAVACSTAVVDETTAPTCDPLLEPACGALEPLCVAGSWTCNGCDPAGAGASDCWDECHGMHAPICEAGEWACLDPNAGGCSAGGGSGGATTTGGAGGGGASGGGGSGAGGSGANCGELSAAIGAETGIVGACVTAVRLDYQSYEILGFQIFCGPYDHPNEADARALAETDTGYGEGNQLLSGAAPSDEWVFWEAAGDFGGTGVVSAGNGLTVFGGSTVWGGSGDITYPDEWRPADDLGPDCVPLVNALPPEGRGFSLESGQALTAEQVGDALDQAWNSALPDGLWSTGYVFDAMVLLYPRSIGAFDPTTAEWIVLLNSGWLE